MRRSPSFNLLDLMVLVAFAAAQLAWMESLRRDRRDTRGIDALPEARRLDYIISRGYEHLLITGVLMLGFGALGWRVAHRNQTDEAGGFLLGLLGGPIGLVVVLCDLRGEQPPLPEIRALWMSRSGGIRPLSSSSPVRPRG